MLASQANRISRRLTGFCRLSISVWGGQAMDGFEENDLNDSGRHLGHSPAPATQARKRGEEQETQLLVLKNWCVPQAGRREAVKLQEPADRGRKHNWENEDSEGRRWEKTTAFPDFQTRGLPCSVRGTARASCSFQGSRLALVRGGGRKVSTVTCMPQFEYRLVLSCCTHRQR